MTVALRYKFIELSVVTDETLEVAVNDWVARGWQLDGIRFVVTEHSKRPAMAFVAFTRDVSPGDEVDVEVEVVVATRAVAAPPGTPPHVIAADDNDVE